MLITQDSLKKANIALNHTMVEGTGWKHKFIGKGEVPRANVREKIIYTPPFGYLNERDDAIVRCCDIHENGHARLTPKTPAEVKGMNPVLQEVLNAVEDCRVEAEASLAFAGAGPALNKGNRLMLDDYNKIAGDPERWNRIGPVSKALIYLSFKDRGLSPHWDIDGQTSKYIEAIEDLFHSWRTRPDIFDKNKGFEEVVQISKEIVEKLKEVKREERKQEQEQQEQEKQEKPEDQEDQEQQDGGDGQDDEQEQDSGDQDGQGKKGKNKKDKKNKPKDLDEKLEDELDKEEGKDKEKGDGDEEDPNGKPKKDPKGKEEMSEDEDGEEGEGEEGESDSDGEDGEDGEGEGEGEEGEGEEDGEDGEGEGSDGENGEDGGDGESDGQSNDGIGGDGAEGDSEDGDGSERDPNAKSGGDRSEEGGHGNPSDGGAEGDIEELSDEELMEMLEQESTGESVGEAMEEEVGRISKDSLEDDPDEYAADTSKDRWEVPPFKQKNYEEAKRKVSSKVAMMTRYIEQSLMSMAKSRVQRNLDGGKFDLTKAYLVPRGLSKNVFYKKKEGKKVNACVSIVVDESGSMCSSNKYYHARTLAIALGECLSKLDIPFEIIGFTTTGGGNWLDDSDPIKRNNPILAKVYKAFSERYNAVKTRLGGIEALNHNVDGENLEFAGLRMRHRRERRKIILSLSDGLPEAGHGNDRIMKANLKRVVKRLREAQVEVYGFGICTTDPQQYYGKDYFVYMPDAEKMGVPFFKKVFEIIGGKKIG